MTIGDAQGPGEGGRGAIWEFVVGFAFSGDHGQVLLIKKARPAWQSGRLNGIGGKVEPGETPEQAMIREFAEETKLEFEPWDLFAIINTGWISIYFYRTFNDLIKSATSVTDEPLMVCGIEDLPPKCLPDVRWLVPLALDALVITPVTIRWRRDPTREEAYPLDQVTGQP